MTSYLRVQPPLSFNAEHHLYSDPITGQVVPSVTTIIERKLNQKKWYKDNGNKERGTRVHSLIEQFFNGLEPIASTEFEALAVIQAASFSQSLATYPTLAVELPVYNDDLGYCGTMDLALESPDGRVLVVDIKTGSSVPSWGNLQTAAYGMGYFKDFESYVAYCQRCILWINPDKNKDYKIKMYPREDNEKDGREFISLL